MRGSPSMCIRQQSTPLSATTPAISGSPRRALTSLTRLAPASSAARATAALEVSIEICGRVGAPIGSPRALDAPAAPARSSSSSADRLGPRPRRLAADVEDVRAFADQLERVRDRRARVEESARRRRTSRASRSRPPSGGTHSTDVSLAPKLGRGWHPSTSGELGALGIAPARSRRCRRPARARQRRGASRSARSAGAGGAGSSGVALLFDAEHFLLALAVEQREELLLLDRLALDEDLGDLRRGRAGAR